MANVRRVGRTMERGCLEAFFMERRRFRLRLVTAVWVEWNTCLNNADTDNDNDDVAPPALLLASSDPDNAALEIFDGRRSTLLSVLRR